MKPMKNLRPVDEKPLSPEEIIDGMENGSIVAAHGLRKHHYFIDNQGRIFSVLKEKPEQLIAKQDSSGQYVVPLFVDEYKKFHTSQLVLLTFRGPPEDETYEPIHIDGDGANDSIDNLVWGSVTEKVNIKSGNVTITSKIKKRLLERKQRQEESVQAKEKELITNAPDIRERDLIKLVIEMHEALKPFAQYHAFNDEEGVQDTEVIAYTINQHGKSQLTLGDLKKAKETFIKTKEFAA